MSPDSMQRWCERILAPAADDRVSLQQFLADIPSLDALADLPSGTPVVIRGDVDAKPGKTVGDGDIRLRSMKETLDYGRQRGWKQIVFGHIGRDPTATLEKVAARLGEILGAPVPLVKGWLNETVNRTQDAAGKEKVEVVDVSIDDDAAATIAAAAPGSVLMLENTRQYEIERVLWKAKPADLAKLAPPLAKLADEFRAKVAKHYVNEALSAGSLDASTLVAPAAMDRAVLGAYVRQQFAEPMIDCLKADLVVFSGLKTDKLDDLEAIISRGRVRWVFAAGSLAMALSKAQALLDGGQFSIGKQEDPQYAKEGFYVSPERVEQARRMIAKGRTQGIAFVLPVDFRLQDGRVSDTIGSGDQQFDIGPKSSALFAQKVDEFIAASQGNSAVAFHNGVFGFVECKEQNFAEGTKAFMKDLKRMKDAGIRVYIGGGEGGKALDDYGHADWVTHVFTAGGTVLNALGSEPVPYLVALRMAAARGK
ncbi:MAG: phosphoglycerate kinase [Planctomycetota bacterium]|nr:MAG: phosphoglycerate kinase [Planctomycetota bacterium]